VRRSIGRGGGETLLLLSLERERWRIIPVPGGGAHGHLSRKGRDGKGKGRLFVRRTSSLPAIKRRNRAARQSTCTAFVERGRRRGKRQGPAGASRQGPQKKKTRLMRPIAGKRKKQLKKKKGLEMRSATTPGKPPREEKGGRKGLSRRDEKKTRRPGLDRSDKKGDRPRSG